MFFCLSSFISFFNLKFHILLKNRSNIKKLGIGQNRNLGNLESFHLFLLNHIIKLKFYLSAVISYFMILEFPILQNLK